ncbi:antibiotic biosynthesis monooxygenase [Burkholderia multivorans]|uniref:antibiotic biosynthesis monooxygenase n=1 Tax=Burkholderia ubonensis TaxID=101571 RepID=UPI00075F0F3C|nr:antibiotic biosynthesis monooxygenase [Burkholderia ubonensis]AYZ65620.1 antibiotic biosynthesis monooxygenase [Burkholderia multivorans]KUZ87467.1 antibiotic biosynthesis monooxygenase [Burkholderia ubonensis]KVC60002.1 antibiotic biosynthesis monooxygenase [Burkholderia ubonensis]KVD87282.1 antibiotic biosynthesis monooxygenase [Burkholderia ubonensis]VWC19983.1 antibiotic biosynthesis monooxygenase [Burkholderia ubonensis]
MANDTLSTTPDSVNPHEVVLVNVVHVFEGKQDAALDVLRVTVNYVARTYPAFQWSRLYKSVDGKTVINQAKWTSKAEFDQLFTDPEFLSRYNGLKETGTWEYHLYQVTDLITPETAAAAVSA